MVVSSEKSASRKYFLWERLVFPAFACLSHAFSSRLFTEQFSGVCWMNEDVAFRFLSLTLDLHSCQGRRWSIIGKEKKTVHVVFQKEAVEIEKTLVHVNKYRDRKEAEEGEREKVKFPSNLLSPLVDVVSSEYPFEYFRALSVSVNPSSSRFHQ